MDILSLLHTAIRMTTPIALAALGGLLGHRAGVLNVALEGMMLSSAFTSVLVSFFTGSYIIGVIVGILSAMVWGLIFSVFGISFKGNLTIVGLAINTLVAGISSYILQTAFGQRGTFSNPNIVGAKPINIPILNQIPIIGDIFNNHTPIVYISIFIAFLVHYILFHTKLGIYIRTVGEMEEAADSVGISATKIRYIAVLIGSVLSGLAGANLSLENVTMFVENMTAGRGFIALAAIYSGGGTSIGTYLFSLLFGLADALQIRLQNINIPGAFIQMIPYLSIVVVLTVIGILNKRKEVNKNG